MRENEKCQLLKNILEEVTKQYDEIISCQRKELKEQFEMAIKDSLTGLYNRSYFIEFASKSLEKYSRDRDEYNIFVIFIDLDNFKFVNDNFGHKEGDRVLKKIAEIIKKSFRSYDIVARLGGDEFIIFLDSSKNSIDIDNTLKKIVEKIESEFKNYLISASYGIASYPQDGTNIDKLIDIADKRMYEFKRKKKSNHVK